MKAAKSKRSPVHTGKRVHGMTRHTGFRGERFVTPIYRHALKMKKAIGKINVGLKIIHGNLLDYIIHETAGNNLQRQI